MSEPASDILRLASQLTATRTILCELSQLVATKAWGDCFDDLLRQVTWEVESLIGMHGQAQQSFRGVEPSLTRAVAELSLARPAGFPTWSRYVMDRAARVKQRLTITLKSPAHKNDFERCEALVKVADSLADFDDAGPIRLRIVEEFRALDAIAPQQESPSGQRWIKAGEIKQMFKVDRKNNTFVKRLKDERGLMPDPGRKGWYSREDAERIYREDFPEQDGF